MRPRTQALKLGWRDRLTDSYIESYLDWREGCVDVHTAHRRWAVSEPRDRELAFLAYRAALDREEKAALVCELIAEQIARRAHH
jgi:hypothetical protein